MGKIIGTWLMDVAKYIATAIILGAVFKGEEESGWFYWLSISVLAVIISSGLILLKNSEKKKT